MKKQAQHCLILQESHMLKNNLIISVLGGLILVASAGSSFGQTIGELAEAAKSKQVTFTAPVAPPPAQTGQAAPVNKGPKIDSGEMLVTSIFTSKDVSQAGISVGDTELFVGHGDLVVNGWTVDTIANDFVVLKRCSNSKRCDSKKLTYTHTH